MFKFIDITFIDNSVRVLNSFDIISFVALEHGKCAVQIRGEGAPKEILHDLATVRDKLEQAGIYVDLRL